MRTTSLAACAALALAACGQAGEAAKDAPAEAPAAATKGADAALPTGPTPGLWRVSVRSSGMPAGAAMPTLEICLGDDAKFDSTSASDSQCEQQTFRREAGVLVGHAVCTSAEGVRTTIDTRVTGDVTRRYTMEVKTTTSPAPSPETAEMTMTSTAERLGDCPASAAQ